MSTNLLYHAFGLKGYDYIRLGHLHLVGHQQRGSGRDVG